MTLVIILSLILFLIFWGIVIFGVLLFILGIIALIKHIIAINKELE